MKSNLGLIGLGTMGSALARNIASRGFKLSLWNRSEEKITEFVEEFGSESFYAPKDFKDFVSSLEKPRRIIIMVPAGKATHAVIDQLLPLLEADDIIMDGGNSHFKDTEEIQEKLSEEKIHFLGTGISGGEEGALKGPSIMPGGTKHAWEAFKPILEAAAAEDFKGKACVSYMGKGGAGHYVKMVHNGIEYAEMQMLAEAYDLLKRLFKLSHEEIAAHFKAWNDGPLNSFLTEIAVDVLRKKEDGKDLLELILDRAGQKGTGRWTSEEALALGVPTPSITSAVFIRGLSSEPEKRSDLSKIYPLSERAPNMLESEFVEHLGKALLTARIINFEQGFALLKEADQTYEFGLNFPEIARIWQGGCIIRCKTLKEIEEALAGSDNSLLFADFAKRILLDQIPCLRAACKLAAEHSVPTSVLSSCLAYFDSIRSSRMPTNLIQGLRDRFGSHGYERVDKAGSFHTNWNEN